MTKSPRKQHSKQSVISDILARQSGGLPLSTDAMNRTCGSLFGAGIRYFGSWPAALAASGIDPDSVKAVRKIRNQWSRAEVISRIQTHAAAGHDLAAHRLSAIDSPLVASAPRYCGSWDEALRMAGFDPEQIRLNKKWSAETVIDRIRELFVKNADLSDSTVSAYDPALYGAAMTHFGRWKEAVIATGVNYQETSRYRSDWTKESLQAEFKKMIESGISVSSGIHYFGLYKAVNALFGSVESAVKTVAASPPRPGSIHCRLRDVRKEKKRSQTALGKMVDKSHRTIGMYELNEITPSLQTAILIAKALNIAVEDIWKG